MSFTKIFFLFSFFRLLALSTLVVVSLKLFSSFSNHFFFSTEHFALFLMFFSVFLTRTDRMHSKLTQLMANTLRFISLKWDFYLVLMFCNQCYTTVFFETSAANTPIDLTFTLRVKAASGEEKINWALIQSFELSFLSCALRARVCRQKKTHKQHTMMMMMMVVCDARRARGKAEENTSGKWEPKESETRLRREQES